MPTDSENKADFNFDGFGSHPTPFLNTSIIGIGDWGCETLKALGKIGVQHAFTLALPTSDDDMAGYRHPAARIIPLKNDKHTDSKLAFANGLLQETDLYIVIFSGKNQFDADVAHRILQSVDSYSKSIAITDTINNLHNNTPKTGNLNATVLVDNTGERHAQHLVSQYILTLVNIMYKHKFMDVEHTQLIRLITHKPFYTLSKGTEIILNQENKYEVGKSLSDYLPSTVSSIIVCLEFGNKAELNLGNFVDSIVINGEASDIQLVVSFVPNGEENNSLVLKLICFD